jgi:hypothetical protein
MSTRLLAVVSALMLLSQSNLAQNPSPEPPSSPKPISRRFISEKDLFNFNWIADPQLSPDGTRVAFTRVIADEKRTGYETSIWTVSTAGGEPPVRMTNGKHDASPRWSPDGRHIAFVRAG